MIVLKKLTQTIQAAGKELELLETPDGTRMLMFPYGARVLGLFSADNQDSFFWNNPRLEQNATAQSLLTSDGWHNTGGDRTWIAPEWDTFFPDANSNAYLQPRKLDMSDYDMERTNGGIQFSRQMTLHLARSNRDVSLRLTKWFGPADNPLRHERDMAAVNAAVEYAGYTQRVTMQCLDELADPQGGRRHLEPRATSARRRNARAALQPHDAAEVLRRHSGGSHDDRGPRAADQGRFQRFAQNRAEGGCDSAAAPAMSTNRGNRYSLVIRNFFVNPSGQYIDVQRHDPDDYGYAFQMCRVDEPQYGSFCELEYHAPALGALPDPARSEDTSQLWAFRGDREAIDAIAQKLLGVKISI